MVLDPPKEYPESKVCIVHPGVVTNSTTISRAAVAGMFRFTNLFTRLIPNITRSELAAAVLEQALHGFSRESLTNNELVEIGSKALKAV